MGVDPSAATVASSGLDWVQTSEIGGLGQRIDVFLTAVSFAVLRPLLAVGLAHSRGVDVAIGRAALDWGAVPTTDGQKSHEGVAL